MRFAAASSTATIWPAYLAAGYFYVLNFGADNRLIKEGPWPWAQGVLMEPKERVFFLVSLLVVPAMKDAGALISLGVKLALMAKVGL